MPEFMLEEDPQGPRHVRREGGGGAHPPSKIVSELVPLVQSMREQNIVGKWYKIARYPKKEGASNAMWLLRENLGKDHTCQGFTFKVGAEVDADENPIINEATGHADALIYARFDPEHIIEGAEEKWQEEVVTRVARRREAARKTNENKRRRDAEAKVRAAAEATGAQLPEGWDADTNTANYPSDEVVDTSGGAVEATAEGKSKRRK